MPSLFGDLGEKLTCCLDGGNQDQYVVISFRFIIHMDLRRCRLTQMTVCQVTVLFILSHTLPDVQSVHWAVPNAQILQMCSLGLSRSCSSGLIVHCVTAIKVFSPLQKLHISAMGHFRTFSNTGTFHLHKHGQIFAVFNV